MCMCMENMATAGLGAGCIILLLAFGVLSSVFASVPRQLPFPQLAQLGGSTARSWGRGEVSLRTQK